MTTLQADHFTHPTRLVEDTYDVWINPGDAWLDAAAARLGDNGPASFGFRAQLGQEPGFPELPFGYQPYLDRIMELAWELRIAAETGAVYSAVAAENAEMAANGYDVTAAE